MIYRHVVQKLNSFFGTSGWDMCPDVVFGINYDMLLAFPCLKRECLGQGAIHVCERQIGADNESDQNTTSVPAKNPKED